MNNGKLLKTRFNEQMNALLHTMDTTSNGLELRDALVASQAIRSLCSTVSSGSDRMYFASRGDQAMEAFLRNAKRIGEEGKTDGA